MCEYNRPYFVPYGQHPDDRLPRPNRTLSFNAWQERAASLAVEQVVVIDQAVEEAAALGGDVHLYRSPDSPYLGISLEPGSGPRVKIWEH